MHGFGARSPNPWIGGGALSKMRPVPPRSAAEIRDFPKETGPFANPRPLPCLRSPDPGGKQGVSLGHGPPP
eukprot:5243385-Pyramimonas_sp.AAC.1